MRINKFIASATGLSRRVADMAIEQGNVTINGERATLGSNVHDQDEVRMRGKLLTAAAVSQSILLHKPVGYVCSRDGQGSQTIYELLPKELHKLKPVGRLDKDSSGIILLTNDGDLAHRLAHPAFHKEKRYRVTLNKSLQAADQKHIQAGVKLIDGPSQLELSSGHTPEQWLVTMHEGRNRQIRRTFQALGYDVVELERIQFGDYQLGDLPSGVYKTISL